MDSSRVCPVFGREGVRRSDGVRDSDARNQGAGAIRSASGILVGVKAPLAYLLVLLVSISAPGCGGDDDGAAGGGDDAAEGGAADAAPAPDTDVTGGGDGGATADAPATTTGEPPELAGITEAHNTVRAAHGVAPLTWDADLAAVAQAWVIQCVDSQAPAGLIDGNANRSATYGSYVGENLFGSTGVVPGPDAVARWASEESDYDYAANACASGESCGSYTQVVWAASTKLGCAFHHCPALSFGYSIVCNYAPGGNDGDRPY
jgi:pathogenesis-related protein 1